MKKFFILYKTTNIITGRYYIGIHATDNLEDGYLGSGVQLRAAIRKYGKDNFCREILELVDSQQSLNKREQEVVSEELLRDPLCMNLVRGGGNYVPSEHNRGCTISQRMKTDTRFDQEMRTQYSISQRGHQRQVGVKNSSYGKKCITDGVHNKRIPKDNEIPTGWRLGVTTKGYTKPHNNPSWFKSTEMVGGQDGNAAHC